MFCVPGSRSLIQDLLAAGLQKFLILLLPNAVKLFRLAGQASGVNLIAFFAQAVRVFPFRLGWGSGNVGICISVRNVRSVCADIQVFHALELQGIQLDVLLRVSQINAVYNQRIIDIVRGVEDLFTLNKFLDGQQSCISYPQPSSPHCRKVSTSLFDIQLRY